MKYTFVGGSLDGKRVNVPEDSSVYKNPIRAIIKHNPSYDGVSEFFSYETYFLNMFRINIGKKAHYFFLIEGMSIDQGIAKLIKGYATT